MRPIKSKRLLFLLLLVLLGFWSILFGAQAPKQDSSPAIQNLFKKIFLNTNQNSKELSVSVLSAPAVVSPPPLVPAESKPIDDIAKLEQDKKADFLALTERTLHELPTKRELKVLSAEEVHFASPQVKESALKLAQIAETLSQSPSLKPQALDFYQQCSLNDQLLTPVRALCLNRALRLYAELHHQLWPYDRSRISRQLVELAGRL